MKWRRHVTVVLTAAEAEALIDAFVIRDCHDEGASDEEIDFSAQRARTRITRKLLKAGRI